MKKIKSEKRAFVSTKNFTKLHFILNSYKCFNLNKFIIGTISGFDSSKRDMILDKEAESIKYMLKYVTLDHANEFIVII